ncbi:Phosphoglycerate mutase-like protein AT74 [Glycine soja]
MNAKRRENMIDVLPKRRILLRHGESQENWDMAAYTTTPDQSIQYGARHGPGLSCRRVPPPHDG